MKGIQDREWWNGFPQVAQESSSRDKIGGSVTEARNSLLQGGDNLIV